MDPIVEATERVFGPIAAFHGTPRSEIDDAERRLEIAIPQKLRTLYETVGRHPFHDVGNHLLTPAELQIAQDHLIIYREQQATCVWGIPVEAFSVADPPVNSSAPKGSGVQFVSEFSSFTQFVGFQLAWHAVEGALPFVGVVIPIGAVAGTRRTEPRAIAFDRVGDVLSRTTSAQVRIRDGAIAFYQADGNLGLAAREAAVFRTVASDIGLDLEDWSHATLQDDDG